MLSAALLQKTLNEIKICNKSWNGQKTRKTSNEVKVQVFNFLNKHFNVFNQLPNSGNNSPNQIEILFKIHSFDWRIFYLNSAV